MSKPAESTKAKALDALDGILEITRNEMLTPGIYASRVVSRKLRDSGSVCSGRRACLVGSLYLAHGERKFSRHRDEGRMLAGVLPARRARFMRHRPGLKLAYDALNIAAQRRIDRMSEGERQANGLDIVRPCVGAAESLFESGAVLDPDYDLDRRKVVSLVRSAKRVVEAA